MRRCEMPATYRVFREYSRSGLTRTIRRGLTLAEAQAHCADPETAANTCTTAAGRARTRRVGYWCEGYEYEHYDSRHGRCSREKVQG